MFQKIEPETKSMVTTADKQSYNTFLSEYLICLPYVIYLFTIEYLPEDK